MTSPLQSPPVSTLRNIRVTLEMIKIEHTLFALPFAFLGAVFAANGLPSLWQILWIIVAMVGARSAAMAFNRIADRSFDAQKPADCIAGIARGIVVSWFRLGVYDRLSGVCFFSPQRCSIV